MADGNIHISVVETDELLYLKHQMNRIELKLDQLLAALEDGENDDADDVVLSLDGTVASRPRNETESLG